MIADSLFRWRFISEGDSGGGLVWAVSMDSAMRKLTKKYPGKVFAVWPLVDDDYFDPEHPEVFNLYD